MIDDLTNLRRIPLRARGDTPDENDEDRIRLVTSRWSGQDTAYLGFAKTVEEHIRMLAGRQWDRWSQLYGRFIDVLQFMTEDEKRYRQRPVMDYLLYWYVLTYSKCIENQTTISFQPATSDHMDAMLAEVMEPIWKTIYHKMQMDQRRARMVAWCLVAGEGYYVTRVDFTKGDKRQVIAPAVLSLEREGQPPIERAVDAVPYDGEGNPRAHLARDPEYQGSDDDEEAYGYEVDGDPYEDLEGEPQVDTVAPLQVRAQWGQHIAWRDKRWIIVETFQTPDQIAEQTGVELPPDHYVGEDSEGGPGYLERMLFGTGYYGAVMEQSSGVATNAIGAQSVATQALIQEGFCRVLTMWEKPVKGLTDETDDSAGGRLLIVAPGQNQVLWDSERPFKTACAGPIRRCQFIDIPGRPQGSTILERLVPMQRRLNRVEGHVAHHTNLCTDPVLLLHEAAGIDEDEFVARPGMTITHGFNGPGDAAKWLVPPPLSGDVWKHKSDVREQMFIIGAMAGNQSAPPTDNASGELVEQLRVNADRPLTPLTTNLAICDGEVAEDVLAILPTIWTEEKLISHGGRDNVVRTVKVTPEMLDGSVHVLPSIESALAESKNERRKRIMVLFQLGAFGDITPGSPERQKAVAQLLELLNFPDLTRATRPGGIDRVMAEHNLGRLVRGDQAKDIPILDVYDLTVHLEVLEGEMKSPEYLNFDADVQNQFVVLRAVITEAETTKQYNTIERQAPLEQAKAAAVGSVQRAGQMAGPPPATPPVVAGPGGVPVRSSDGQAGPQGGPGTPGAPPTNAPPAGPGAPKPSPSAPAKTRTA